MELSNSNHRAPINNNSMNGQRLQNGARFDRQHHPVSHHEPFRYQPAGSSPRRGYDSSTHQPTQGSYDAYTYNNYNNHSHENYRDATLLSKYVYPNADTGDLPSLTRSESSSFELSSDEEDCGNNRFATKTQRNASKGGGYYDKDEDYDYDRSNVLEKPSFYKNPEREQSLYNYDKDPLAKRLPYKTDEYEEYYSFNKVNPRSQPGACHEGRENSGVEQQSKITQIEFAPGEFLPLRGAKETWEAVLKDFYMPCNCVACSTMILCIADAGYVLCPFCQVVGQVNKEGCDDNHGNSVGLGFSMASLAQWQKELESGHSGR